LFVFFSRCLCVPLRRCPSLFPPFCSGARRAFWVLEMVAEASEHECKGGIFFPFVSFPLFHCVPPHRSALLPPSAPLLRERAGIGFLFLARSHPLTARFRALKHFCLRLFSFAVRGFWRSSSTLFLLFTLESEHYLFFLPLPKDKPPSLSQNKPPPLRHKDGSTLRLLKISVFLFSLSFSTGTALFCYFKSNRNLSSD